MCTQGVNAGSHLRETMIFRVNREKCQSPARQRNAGFCQSCFAAQPGSSTAPSQGTASTQHIPNLTITGNAEQLYKRPNPLP